MSFTTAWGEAHGHDGCRCQLITETLNDCQGLQRLEFTRNSVREVARSVAGN